MRLVYLTRLFLLLWLLVCHSLLALLTVAHPRKDCLPQRVRAITPLFTLMLHIARSLFVRSFVNVNLILKLAFWTHYK